MLGTESPDLPLCLGELGHSLSEQEVALTVSSSLLTAPHPTQSGPRKAGTCALKQRAGTSRDPLTHHQRDQETEQRSHAQPPESIRRSFKSTPLSSYAMVRQRYDRGGPRFSRAQIQEHSCPSGGTAGRAEKAHKRLAILCTVLKDSCSPARLLSKAAQ